MSKSDDVETTLMAEILEADSHSGSAKCALGVALKRLSPEDRAAVEKFLLDDTISTIAIYRALKNRGYRISESGVRRHRRGDCKCPRENA